MVRLWGLAVLGAVVIVTAACSDSSSDPTRAPVGGDSNSSGISLVAPAPTTTAPPAGDDAATTTTIPPSPTSTVPPPRYSIEARTRAASGDTVVVLVEPGDYGEAQLEFVVVDAVERFAPIGTLHVVDHSAAVSLVLEASEDLETEQQAFLAEHYLVRLEEGFRMIFQGPFDDLGEIVLGS